MANVYKTIGQVLESKPEYGGGFYLSLGAPRKKDGSLVFSDGISFPLTINEGEKLYFDDPREAIDRKVEAGKLSEVEGAALKAKIPAFKKYDVKIKG